MILRGWTSEKVMLALHAPSIAMDGQHFAYPQRWAVLGCDGFCAWGTIDQQGRVNSAIQTKLDLFKIQREDFAKGGACTCEKKGTMPCEHMIGLLLLLIENDTVFIETTPPEHTEQWLDKSFQRAKRAYLRRQEGQPADFDRAALEARRQQRLKHVRGGMQELELWLENLVRHGLVNPRVQETDFWKSIADRMVDAQAPAVAQHLVETGKLTIQDDGWIEVVLERLSRLYLLAKSYHRYEKLPPEAQADMRSAVGWYDKPEEVSIESAVEDQWVVFAHEHYNVHDRLREQKVWLYGKSTQRYALLHEFAFDDVMFDTYFTIGNSFKGELVFYPSQHPMRAYIHQIHEEGQAQTTLKWGTIHDCINRYSAALAVNPWIKHFPAMLDHVIPTQLASGWALREEDGTYLPVSPEYNDKWVLLSLSGGHPIQIGGTWDGGSFHPMTAVAEKRWVNLKRLERL
jgi:hypothetical protein